MRRSLLSMVLLLAVGSPLHAQPVHLPMPNENLYQYRARMEAYFARLMASRANAITPGSGLSPGPATEVSPPHKIDPFDDPRTGEGDDLRDEGSEYNEYLR